MIDSALSALLVIVPAFIVIVVLCSLVWPRAVWFLSEGWKFKNVEPSGFVLVAIRLGGVLGLVAILAIASRLWK
jgi:hypothetical protein